MRHYTSELGPIDPQMLINAPGGQQLMRPAIAFIDAYLDLIKKTQDAIKTNNPPHPFLELLRKLDPTWINICLKARDLSKKIATEYLTKYMLQAKTDEEIELTVRNFMKVGEEASHGRVIRAEKAKDYGLDIEIIEKNSNLNKVIWELYLRCENYVQSKGLAKYFVGNNGGINIQVQKQ